MLFKTCTYQFSLLTSIKKRKKLRLCYDFGLQEDEKSTSLLVIFFHQYGLKIKILCLEIETLRKKLI